MNKYFGTIRIWLFNAFLILLFAFTYLKYIKLALTPNVDVQSIPSTKDRGSIVDRSGKRLAVQTDFYHFIVTPRDVTDVEYFAQAVAPALDMNPYEIVQMINANSNRSFLYVKKRLDEIYGIYKKYGMSKFYYLHRLAFETVKYFLV